MKLIKIFRSNLGRYDVCAGLIWIWMWVRGASARRGAARILYEVILRVIVGIYMKLLLVYFRKRNELWTMVPSCI